MILNRYKPSIYSSARTILITLATVVSACVLYLLLDKLELKHSAALFIGIPVYISIVLAASTGTRHLTLKVLLGLSAGLIASFLYLNEGSFCVPMTAPLFLLSGLVISYSFIHLKKSSYSQTAYFIPVLLLMLLALEGTSSFTSANRNELISITKESSLSPKQIKHALTQTRQFKQLPVLLSWGFPQPQSVTGSGSNTGDIRSIYFSGGEGEPGTTTFTVSHTDKNSIEYSLLTDESHISHWLEWETSKVSWKMLESGNTLISWDITYKRKLDPSWYFAPLQNYAVKLVAESLIDNMILQGR